MTYKHIRYSLELKTRNSLSKFGLLLVFCRLFSVKPFLLPFSDTKAYVSPGYNILGSVILLYRNFSHYHCLFRFPVLQFIKMLEAQSVLWLKITNEHLFVCQCWSPALNMETALFSVCFCVFASLHNNPEKPHRYLHSCENLVLTLPLVATL